MALTSYLHSRDSSSRSHNIWWLGLNPPQMLVAFCLCPRAGEFVLRYPTLGVGYLLLPCLHFSPHVLCGLFTPCCAEGVPSGLHFPLCKCRFSVYMGGAGLQTLPVLLSWTCPLCTESWSLHIKNPVVLGKTQL